MGASVGEAGVTDCQRSHPATVLRVLDLGPLRAVAEGQLTRARCSTPSSTSRSAEPSLRFHFVPRGAGILRAEVEDTKDNQFVGKLAVRTATTVTWQSS